jgi:geranylgeranyl diphosphate synthase type I
LRPKFAPPELLSAILAYPQAGGKALRPTILSLACRALGGDETPALRAGVAVELYHTYTLVHDDIIDRDPVRRGHPSVHTQVARHGEEQFHLSREEAAHYGVSVAILTGDIQQAWSIGLLASLPDLGVDPRLALALIHRLESVTGPAILEGEALDIQLPFLPIETVSGEMIQRVMLTKTAALFVYCAWAGGMLARGQEDDDVARLSAFAESLGIAFQLQDDVLGLIADPAVLGKPVGNDLREGKRTFIIALAWERASEAARARIRTVLGNPAATDEDIQQITALLERLGAIGDVQAMADRYLAQALDHLVPLPPSSALTYLRELAGLMTRREK